MTPSPPGTPLHVKSLRTLVYEYLREQINRGDLNPGATLNLNQIAEQLGISKTPLRDALIQLECEGFVTILPRRGVVVRRLSLTDVKNSWEICRALEVENLGNVFERVGPDHLGRMTQLNLEMDQASLDKDFQHYHRLNVDFHQVLIDLSDNAVLKDILALNKQLLYDFPRMLPMRGWEEKNIAEHDDLLRAIAEGRREDAKNILHDVHWSFDSYRDYFREFYVDMFGED